MVSWICWHVLVVVVWDLVVVSAGLMLISRIFVKKTTCELQLYVLIVLVSIMLMICSCDWQSNKRHFTEGEVDALFPFFDGTFSNKADSFFVPSWDVCSGILFYSRYGELSLFTAILSSMCRKREGAADLKWPREGVHSTWLHMESTRIARYDISFQQKSHWRG